MRRFAAIFTLLALLTQLAGAAAFQGWPTQQRCPMECCASVADVQPSSCRCIEPADPGSDPTPALPSPSQRDSQSLGVPLPPAHDGPFVALPLPPQIIEASKGLVSPHHRFSARLSVLLCSLLN